MKIIEVRDGFIKFEADESVYLSSFVQAEGTDKNYIAQVNQVRKIANIYICTAKILFISVNGELQNYDKTEPVRDAEVTPFDIDILLSSINVKDPVIAGKTLDNKNNIIVDSSAFNKKILISIDGVDTNNIVVRNLSKQFENLGVNTVVVDTRGVINAKKCVAGKDFKLPLDKDVLAFMYKSCLNDVTADSKATITEIFRDLSEYADTVPFVPFKTLKAVVDDLVDKQHVFKLFVLKNKLAKFEYTGYFATTKDEVENLDKILDSKLSILDLSKLDTLFQNYFIEYIYKKLKTKNTQVIFEVSNTVSKKNLKLITVDSEVSTALAVHSGYPYLNDIKNMFDDFIIENTIQNKKLFKIYSTFFESMAPDTYLIAGEAVNYIPLVSKAQIIDDYASREEYVKPITEEPEIVLPDENEQEQFDGETITEEFPTQEELSTLEEQNKEENFVDSKLSENELNANIEEKSNRVIDSIAENLDETQNVELFDDKESDEEDDKYNDVEIDPVLDIEEESEVIEPEYSEIEESQSDDIIPSEDFIQDENIIEDSSELSEVIEPEVLQEDNEIINDDTISDLQEDELDDSIEGIELSVSDFEEESESLDDDIIDNQEENNDVIESANDVTLELDAEDELLLQENAEDDLNENFDLTEDEPSINAETQVMPINDNDDDLQNYDEIVELDNVDEADTDIIVDITDNNEDVIIDEAKEKEISADVDKMYTTLKSDDELEEISDSDLDLIDALNNEEEPLNEFSEEIEEYQSSEIDDGILEQPQESVIPERQHRDNDTSGEILEKREANTPIVPVYDADIPPEDMVVSDPIQQGDSVIHAKYGNGVVEKMIKYGNKTLFSINFENIGRRLLDPTLTEIRKI